MEFYFSINRFIILFFRHAAENSRLQQATRATQNFLSWCALCFIITFRQLQEKLNWPFYYRVSHSKEIINNSALVRIEDTDLDFCWYLGSYVFMRERLLCLIHQNILLTLRTIYGSISELVNTSCSFINFELFWLFRGLSSSNKK